MITVANVRNGKQAAFLTGITATLSISQAARLAEVSRDAHYFWLRDPEYRQQFTAAWEMGVQKKEAEVTERAALLVKPLRLPEVAHA